MRIYLASFVLTVLGLVAADSKRCDGAEAELKCADVPDIMALNTTECQDFHFLIARGTDERAPGRMGNVTKLLCDQLGGRDHCGWESVDYPAKNRFLSNNTWCESADIGVRNGQRQLKDYTDRCPESKVILMGYSQGASVMQDIIGGGGGPIFRCTQSLNKGLSRSESPGANLAAVVTFGTVRRVSGERYSFGSGKDFRSEGNRTEQHRQGLEPYAGIIRDYCNKGDPICATDSKPLDLKHHLTYMQDYQENIIDFVLGKVDEMEAAEEEREMMEAGQAEGDHDDRPEDVPEGDFHEESMEKGHHADSQEEEEGQDDDDEPILDNGLPPPVDTLPTESIELPVTSKILPPPMVLQHRPLLHQLQNNYWLMGALFFSLSLSWSALYYYTSQRRKLSRGF